MTKDQMNRQISCVVAAAAVLAAFATPAAARQSENRFQVKGFLTAVLPSGEIADVERDGIGLPAGSQTAASDSFVPTIAAEYFFSPNLSVETICCVTPHDVEGEGALAGAALIDDAIILPATVTAKYHVALQGGLKPYVGAGVTHFFIFGEEPGRDAAALGATEVDLSDEFGFVLQAGFDLPINDRGLGLSLDAKRYFVETTATFRAGSSTALQTVHQLDPWVISAGLSYRF
jgi:outer membrane protein